MSTSKTVVALFVWITASLFYAYQYILRVMPNIMLNDIMQQFNIDAAIFGQFSGVYYIGYSLLHLPIGIMLDRIGPRKVMSGCILLTVIGMLPLIYADKFIYPVLGRALIGVGSSAAILGAFKIIRITFSEKYFTRMLSFTVTIGLLGAIYGGSPVRVMFEELGYEKVIQIFAGLGILLAVVSYCIIPEMKAEERGSVLKDLNLVLRKGKVLALCFFAGLMVGPIEGFADVWATIFLKKVYLLDASIASYLPSTIFIGMCFGAPLLSFIGERTKNYGVVIIGSGIAMFTVFAFLVLGEMQVNYMTFGFALVGMCSAYQILAIYKASTYVPEHVAGLTTAIANMIIMAFGYCFHTAIGFIVTAFGGPDQPEALVLGISVIPVTLLLGTAGFMVIAAHDAIIRRRKR